jgi:aspartate aminotransferase-like enzyme
VSERAWAALDARHQPVRSWYLNLGILRAYRQKWQNWHPQGPNTAPVSLYRALDQSLDEILAEGLADRFARHVRVRDAFRAGIRAMGLDLFAADACASKTLTAVRLPDAIDGTRLQERLLSRHDILIAGGIGDLANKMIRIGHLARTASDACLIPVLQALETELAEMGLAVRPGVAADAFQTTGGLA